MATFATEADNVDFDDDVFNNAARLIFETGRFDASMLSDPAIMENILQTFNILSSGIGHGIGYELPESLRYALENNAFVFSGFKTFHAMREVGLSLLTPGGDIKPFNTFLADVKAINDRYNHNYLRAEYQQAVAASQMAVHWNEFEKDGDRYDLQYRTAGDDRVREEHAILHNTTLPIDDPFWDSFLPPNGWGCRCTTVQVRKGKYPASDPELAMRRGQNCTDGAKRKMFRFNPGKAMRLYPEKHPYFPKGCGSCSRNLNLAFDPKRQICVACAEILRLKRIIVNRLKYNRLKNDKNYRDVHYNPDNGGLKASHTGHNFDKRGGIYEHHAQEAGYKAGHAVILENEKFGNVGERFTEGTWDLLKFEVAGCENGTSNNILRGLKHCASKRETEIAVIDFPNTDFDLGVFNNALRRYIGLEKLKDGQFLKFKKIICIHNEEIVHVAEL